MESIIHTGKTDSSNVFPMFAIIKVTKIKLKKDYDVQNKNIFFERKDEPLISIQCHQKIPHPSLPWGKDSLLCFCYLCTIQFYFI